MEDRPDLGGWRIDEIDEDNVPYEPVSAPPPAAKLLCWTAGCGSTIPRGGKSR